MAVLMQPALMQLPDDVRFTLFNEFLLMCDKLNFMVATRCSCGGDTLGEARKFRSTYGLFREALEPLEDMSCNFPCLVTAQPIQLELSPTSYYSTDPEAAVNLALDVDSRRDMSVWLSGFAGPSHRGFLEELLELNFGHQLVRDAISALRMASFLRCRWYPHYPEAVDDGEWNVPGAILVDFELHGFLGMFFVEDPENLDSDTNEDDDDAPTLPWGGQEPTEPYAAEDLESMRAVLAE
jgi:hypothetical protein